MISPPKNNMPYSFLWELDDILAAVNGTLAEKGAKHITSGLSGISIDTRTLFPGQAYVAICGENHDGHDFTHAAIQKGAGCVIIQGDRLPQIKKQHQAAVVAVSDTTAALGSLAAFHRKRCAPKVTAITGSNGKTTVRMMMAAVMSQKFNTLSTQGNLNNEIGLPLTLLGLKPTHQWAVVELGMNHSGEIARLSRICRPDMGVITNVAPAHLEGLKTLFAVAAAKGELLDEMPASGAAVLNGDDPRVAALAEKRKKNVVLFGRGKNAHVRAENIRTKADGVWFDLMLPESPRQEIFLPVFGEFMVENALAAAAAGLLAGVEPAAIKAALGGVQPEKGRMEIIHTAKKIHIIHDAYNANPASMAAAIQTFAALKGKNQGFLVLGDMLELGDDAPFFHEKIGRKAGASGAKKLYTTGALADCVAAGAIAAGMAPENIRIDTKARIAQDLKNRLSAGDWILIKGSRGMAMEEVLHLILDKKDENNKKEVL